MKPQIICLSGKDKCEEWKIEDWSYTSNSHAATNRVFVVFDHIFWTSGHAREDVQPKDHY